MVDAVEHLGGRVGCGWWGVDVVLMALLAVTHLLIFIVSIECASLSTLIACHGRTIFYLRVGTPN